MAAPGILLVEAEVLARHPLAEYLRACGYKVFEAADAEEARLLIETRHADIDILLSDAAGQAGNGFTLVGWIRANHPSIQIILAGTIGKATDKAGALCEEGPAEDKPTSHKYVLQRIQTLLANRKGSGAVAS